MADDGARSASHPHEGYCCKVGRVGSRHGLATMDERLSSRWQGSDGERLGLRGLKTFFNRAILRAAMQDAGLDPLRGEVADIYKLLDEDSSNERARRHARSKLERAGIDVESIRRDFVSHPTIGTHLKECLRVDPPRQPERGSVEKIEERVYKLQNRTEAVVRGSIEQLRAAGRIEAGEFDVFVGTQVICERCGVQYDVHDFLDRGGCECTGIG